MPMLGPEDFEGLMPQMISIIRELVEIESPTDEHASINQVVELVARHATERGAVIRRLHQTGAGDHLVAQWGIGEGGVLLLTHLDTVHPHGALKINPIRREGNRMYGPGILDMKSGVAMALVVIGAILDQAPVGQGRIRLLCTSDEETGSLTSRSLIESLAAESELVLCLEAGLADGAVKTRRKGIGAFVIETLGRAAHSGVSPEDGVNAILEMANQLHRLVGIQDLAPGTTVNPGTIEGGTRSNIVPDWCRLRLDVRIDSAEAATSVDEFLADLNPILDGAQVQVSGGWNRPQMPRTEAIAHAFIRAQAVASELGFELGEGGTGGGSDANFVAPLDVPLLDGLGPIGSGAHTATEFIHVDSLPRRAALLAGLLTGPG
jgi:glutamate carboxypeptidase